MSLPRSFRRLCALAGLLAVGTTALAQAWPTKPVNLMVPYPAGGPSDAIARIMNTPLGKELGQQVLVDIIIALFLSKGRCTRRLVYSRREY